MLVFPHIPLSFYVLLIIILNTVLFLKLCIYVGVYVVCAAKEARRGCRIPWIWSHSGWELPKVGAKNWTLICWKEQEGTLHALNCQAISTAPVIKHLKILFCSSCVYLRVGVCAWVWGQRRASNLEPNLWAHQHGCWEPNCSPEECGMTKPYGPQTQPA